MEPFECKGLWWLPDYEDERVGGVLKVSNNGYIELSLIGSLGGNDEPRDGRKSHSLIHGSVDESPYGSEISLKNSVLTGHTIGSFLGVREEYAASVGYFGAHLGDADFSFQHLTVRLGGLDEWIYSLSGFQRGHLQRFDLGTRVPVLHYTQHSPITGSIPEAEISVGFSLNSSRRLHKYSFREVAEIVVDCESAHSDAELNRAYVYPLQNLMTLVCDRAQRVERFSVRRSQDTSEIHVIARRVQPGDEKGMPNHVEMLFRSNDIEGSFADFISRWVQITQVYSDACTFFFGYQYDPPAYVDATFLTIVQALRLYHARRPQGITLREKEEHRLQAILAGLDGEEDRQWILEHVGIRPCPPFHRVLTELVHEHGHALDALISGRRSGFINAVENSLHYEIQREPDLSLAASRGADLYWMTQKLRFLMKACLLHELGFSASTVASLFERNALYGRICEVENERESAQTESSPG